MSSCSLPDYTASYHIRYVIIVNTRNLTFRGRCIVIYSYNKTQKDVLFINFISVKNSTYCGQIYRPSRILNTAELLSRYSDRLRAGRSGDQILVGARFSTSVQTGPEAHPASCTMGTGAFLGVKSGRGVKLTHSLLVPWSKKGRAIPLLPLWAVRPVQSLSAFTRVTFTFTL